MRWTAAALCALASLAHAEGRAPYGGSAQIALPSLPTSLDPVAASAAGAGPAARELAPLLFDAPFTIGDDGRAIPALATALEATATRARLQLRGDVKFHDGRSLRAADVAASLERARNDARAGWLLAPIRSVHAAGDTTVELELERSTPELELLLATPLSAILAGGAPGGTGSGPFIVESNDAGGVRLRANNACWAGRPRLASLLLRAFSTRADESGAFEVGTLTASREAPSTLRRSSTPHVDGPLTEVGFLALGRAVGPELRRAISLAIDRDRLRRLAVPPPSQSWPATFDAQRARASLPANTVPLHLLLDRTRIHERDIADRLLADLTRAGLMVTLDAVEAPLYQQRLASGSYDLAFGTVHPALSLPGFVELTLAALNDPTAVRAAFARAPAGAAAASLASVQSRILPLYRAGARVYHADALHGLAIGADGTPRWADAWLRAR